MISVFNGRSRSLGAGGGEEVHVQVSIALRKHLHLFKGAKLGVFMAIALHSNKDGWSHPSTKALCKETGLNPDTIFNALSELCGLRVEGHRVLLRKGTRKTGGQFSNNYYLIFPTAEEVSKFETPDLFGTVSEKPDTAKDRHGKKPCRKKTVSEKSDKEVEPVIQEELQATLSALPAGSAKKLETHTHELKPAANSNGRDGPKDVVCVKSNFEFEIIRNYAWESFRYYRWLQSRNPGRKVQGIYNPEGWATSAYRTGTHDALIQEWLDDPTMFERR